MSDNRFMLRAAVYLVLQKGGEVFLLRRCNTGWMDGYFTLASGHIEENETVGQAIIRETREEAGVTVAPEDLHPLTVLHRKSPDYEYIDFFYSATRWEGEPHNHEPEKCDTTGWYSLQELPNNILPYVGEVLRKLKSLPVFFEFGWDG